MKFFITLSLAFTCWTLHAQCPPQSIALNTQEEVNTFVATYPNCTEINGDLRIGNAVEESDVIDLSGLSAITSVVGRLLIINNDILPDLDGLSAITSVGEALDISDNGALTSLSGLSGITSVGGFLMIRDNDALTSLNGLMAITLVGGTLQVTNNDALADVSGVANIDASSLGLLLIASNPQLSVCAVESICDYLSVDMSEASIADNAVGCASREEVATACVVSTTDISQTSIELFPNPTNGRLQLRNIIAEEVVVYTTQGQRVARYNTPDQELDLSALPAGVYHLHLIAADAADVARVVKQ